MAKYTVTGPMIVVYEAGQQRYLKRGAEVPDTVDKDHIKQLLDAGLIDRGTSISASPAPAPTDPARMNASQLKAYAAERSIELGNASKVDELRTVILAAEAKAPDSEAPSQADIDAADNAGE